MNQNNRNAFADSRKFSIFMKFLKLFYFLIFIFALQVTFAQDKLLSKANDEFEAKQYTEAEANYRISESKNPKNVASVYNLGNSIYRINQAVEAGLVFAKAAKIAKIRPDKHQAFHNLGNTAMKVKDYSLAVNAYKQALINSPSDEETRYNYALAKKMLKENPPKKDDKKKDKDKDKDKKDDKKDQKDQKEDPKEGDGKNPKQDQPKQGQQKETPGEISKQRLQNLLEAVNNEEKKVQEKVNKNKEKSKPTKTEKDW